MVNRYHDRRLIGEILLERGLVTQDQLEQALLVQRMEGGGYLGDILIRLGFAREIDIVIALVVQCNLPYIAISKYTIADDVAALIPKDMACQQKLVPLDRIGSVLSVVMHNPLDDTIRRKVEQLTGCHVAVFISTRAEIDRALERFYPAGGY